MKLKARMSLFLLLALALLPGLLCSVRTANAVTRDPVLYVCGNPVYGDASDPDGETWVYIGDTLTLTNFTCDGKTGIGIPSTRTTDLNIVLNGASTITDTAIGIYVDDDYNNNVTISGTGSLRIEAGTDGINFVGTGILKIAGGTINSTSSSASGIYTRCNLEINGGTVTAAGTTAGIYVFGGDHCDQGGGLKITGGTVRTIAKGTDKYAHGGIWIQDGTYVATFSGGTVESSGLYGVDGGAWVEIGSGVTSVTLIGTNQAIRTYLLNPVVKGTGWTNTAGTEGESIIDISAEKQNVYQYKKAVFPSEAPKPETVKVTFKVVNGSWNNGSSTDQTVTLDKGKSLTADQIPAVGEKPNAGYEAGSWDTTPDTTSAINSDTTFTYTYKAKDPVKVTVSVVPAEGGTVTSDPADLSAVAQGAKVTLTASHNAGYVLDKWEVTSGGVKLSSETGETTSFTTGEENVAITAHFKKAEPMVKQVEFVFVNKNTSKRGLPDNIKETTLNVKIEIKKDGKTVSSVTNVELPINKETGSSVKQNLTFTPGLADFDTFAYTFAGSVSPAQLEEDVTSQDPDFEPKKYNLSVRMDAQMEKDKKSILFYIDWDDGSSVAGPEIIKVYALPEDAIGAYKLRDDGTKEYLIFHTYAICMNWLGSDELCRGYERCFHKESPYANPFVKP
ncbi:MAG: hypothetical protein IJI14_19475 [Anaerolineaceae bacterium]|nr:hypothetical protein [Anaerolineaceae bacterium]